MESSLTQQTQNSQKIETYLIKRSPKCLQDNLFYLECKLKLRCLTVFMEIHMGGGVFELGNPEGRGAQAVLVIQVEGEVKKPWLPSWGCGFFLE